MAKLRVQVALWGVIYAALATVGIAHGDADPQCESVSAAADIQAAISNHEFGVRVCIDRDRCGASPS